MYSTININSFKEEAFPKQLEILRFLKKANLQSLKINSLDLKKFFSFVFAILLIIISTVIVIAISPIILYFLISGYNKAKKIDKNLKEFLNALETQKISIDDYEKAIEIKNDIEKHNDLFLNAYIIFGKIGLKKYSKKINSIQITLLKIREFVISTYTIDKSEIFDSEEDFEEYKEAFSCFNDIWNYETPDEDRKIIFDIKNKEAC